MENADNKRLYSKILFWALSVSVILVLLISYNKYISSGDFLLYAQVSCNPESESCFARMCTPEEDESCPEDPGKQVWYYKVISKKASNAPKCDPQSELGCPELACEFGEDSCEIIYCSLDNATRHQDGKDCW